MLSLIISTSKVAIVKFMIYIVFSVLVSVIGLIGFLCSVFVNFIVMNDFYIVALYYINYIKWNILRIKFMMHIESPFKILQKRYFTIYRNYNCT